MSVSCKSSITFLKYHKCLIYYYIYLTRNQNLEETTTKANKRQKANNKFFEEIKAMWKRDNFYISTHNDYRYLDVNNWNQRESNRKCILSVSICSLEQQMLKDFFVSKMIHTTKLTKLLTQPNNRKK